MPESISPTTERMCPGSSRPFKLGDFPVELRVELLELSNAYTSAARASPTPGPTQYRVYGTVLSTHIVVMVPPHVVRELVAEHPPHLPVRPEAVVRVRAEPQLDRLPRVHVQPEQVRLLVRRELRQHAHRELVPLHHVADRGVVRELREQLARRVGVREVRERLDTVEGVRGVGGGERGRSCGPGLRIVARDKCSEMVREIVG